MFFEVLGQGRRTVADLGLFFDFVQKFLKNQTSYETCISQRRIEFHPARKPHSFSNRNADFHLETLNPNSGSSQKPATFVGNAISSVKQSDDGDLLELGLDAELFSGITFRRIGAGLENLGNTCFLNSVLQCLTYTEPFAAYLQSGKHKSSCHIAGFCAMCAIQNHVSRVLQSTGRILAPKDLVMNLRCISRNFRNARQEDAHEYMVNLLESMHKCSLPSGVPTESASAYEKSLVHKIFGGRLRSQVKCTQCSHCSNTFDPFLDLSLEILKADSLLKALTHFTAVEQLDGGEREYHCQCCKQKVRALKQLTVHKAPYVLSIHLKRFGSLVPGQKINKKVEFRPTLDLKPYVSGSYEGDLKYTLYGVLVHAGWSTHSGHYYCFVRTSAGMWYSLDDNRVVQVSEKTVLEQKAYMLFYFRDRKNLVPKKQTNVARKENIMPSSLLGDGGRFVTSSNKKAIQNGPRMIKSGCSSAATVKDAVSSDPLDEHRLKEASFHKTKDLNMAGSSALLRDSMGNTLKEQVKGPSSSILHLVDNQRVAEGLIQSVPLSCKGSGSTSHPTVRNVGENVDRGSGDPRSHDLSGVTVAPVELIGSQNPDLMNKVTQENQGDGKDLNNQPCQLTKENGLGSERSAVVEVPSQFSVMNGSVQKKELDHHNHRKDLKYKKKFTKTKENGEELDHHNHRKDLKYKKKFTKTKENGLGSEGIGLAEVSNQTGVMNGSVQKKDLDHHNHKTVLKPKKKIMKRHCVSLHLGSKLSLKTSLGLCKKKKHKKNKKNSSKLSSIRVNSDLDSANGLKLLVSEKMVKFDSTHSSKQHKKSDRKKDDGKAAEDVKISGGDSMVNIVRGDLKERVCLNTAVLATGEPQRKSSSMILEATQCDTREPDSSLDTKRKICQSDLMGMLTRGIEDVTVPRWDGESRPSQVLGFKSSQSISIGYVPDEWDEEYDRGKRKKVRGPKDSFGGPNPFQEIATMKEQSKKPKRMDKRNSSGNQPFRI